MVKILVEVSEVANKKLRIYMIHTDIKTKSQAVNTIIESMQVVGI